MCVEPWAWQLGDRTPMNMTRILKYKLKLNIHKFWAKKIKSDLRFTLKSQLLQWQLV